MRTVEGDVWKRVGLSLLWGPEALGEIAKPAEVASIRDLYKHSRGWPENLPSNAGKTLVVAGVEGCLDCLTPEDAEEWIDADLRPVLLAFRKSMRAMRAHPLAADWLSPDKHEPRQRNLLVEMQRAVLGPGDRDWAHSMGRG